MKNMKRYGMLVASAMAFGIVMLPGGSLWAVRQEPPKPQVQHQSVVAKLQPNDGPPLRSRAGNRERPRQDIQRQRRPRRQRSPH